MGASLAGRVQPGVAGALEGSEWASGARYFKGHASRGSGEAERVGADTKKLQHMFAGANYQCSIKVALPSTLAHIKEK